TSLPAKLIRHKALQAAYCDGLIDGTAPAGNFTRCAANASTNGRQRVGAPRDLICAIVLTLRNRTHIAARIGMDRTGILALDLPSPIILVGQHGPIATNIRLGHTYTSLAFLGRSVTKVTALLRC